MGTFEVYANDAEYKVNFENPILVAAVDLVVQHLGVLLKSRSQLTVGVTRKQLIESGVTPRIVMTFRGNASFKTWLFSITVNVCRTRLHRQKRRGSAERLQKGFGTLA